MKSIRSTLHIICILLIPGYWIGALLVYTHHKVKKQPVKFFEEERKIEESVHNKIHAHKK